MVLKVPGVTSAPSVSKDTVDYTYRIVAKLPGDVEIHIETSKILWIVSICLSVIVVLFVLAFVAVKCRRLMSRCTRRPVQANVLPMQVVPQPSQAPVQVVTQLPALVDQTASAPSTSSDYARNQMPPSYQQAKYSNGPMDRLFEVVS